MCVNSVPEFWPRADIDNFNAGPCSPRHNFIPVRLLLRTRQIGKPKYPADLLPEL
jgi:hypothetical protein